MRVGSLWGGTFRKGPGYIWKIVRDGSVQHWTDLPDAVFINSCTLDPNRHTLLACESLMGRILAINLGAPGRWSAWLTDGRLKPNHPQFPGAPTASRFGTAGPGSPLWTEPHSAHTVVADGRPGPIETAATQVFADDFASATSGSLYIATHPEQTVFRLDAAGNRTTVAGPTKGAVGTTACALGRAPEDENALYVTTDGRSGRAV